MNKIKILLIDDNPTFARLGELNKGDGKEEFKILLGKDNLSEKDETILLDYKDTLPLLLNFEEGIDFFEFKWIHSEFAAKEYYNAMNFLESKYDYKQAERVGFIPDIVVFDYDLGNVSIPKPRSLDNSDLKKVLDPCHELRSYLETEKNVINGEEENNKKTKRYELTQGVLDNKTSTIRNRLGLYCGALIVSRYKQDMPCCGVPCTYVNKDDIDGSDPGFVEWFLNEKFPPGIRTEEGKAWKKITNVAMPIYRASILELIKLNKIHVNLNELIKLLDGDFLPSKNRERKFTFHSIYGNRELPLDGLFIDINTTPATGIPPELQSILNGDSITEREIAIWKFAKEIFDIRVSEANLGKNIGHNEIKQALEIAESLWNAYTGELFEDRYKLSDYTYRNSELNNEDRKDYNSLLEKYANGNSINKSKKVSILEKSGSPSIIKLAILHLILKAEIRFKELFALNQKDDYKPLSEEEMYYLLNPFQSGDLILPIHYLNGVSLEVPKTVKKYHDNNLLKTLSEKIGTPRNQKDFYSFNWIDESTGENWISEGRKILLRSLFNDKEEFYPDWLKKQ
jgi:hypothetical protein